MIDFPTMTHSSTADPDRKPDIVFNSRPELLIDDHVRNQEEAVDRLDLKEALWRYDPRPVRRRVHPGFAVAGLLLLVAFVGRWVTS